jgi:peptidyl-prolyl cis-trans isomerase C
MPLIINGQTIDDDVIFQEFDGLKQQALRSPNPPHCCELDPKLMVEARQNIIARTLLNEEAKRLDYAVPADEVEAAYTKVKEEHGGEEWFYIHHAATKDQDPKFKEGIELNLMVQRLLDERCGDHPDPGDDEVERYYREHLDQLIRPEQVHAAHIVKRLDQDSNRAEAYKVMAEVRRQLVEDGADFAALCKEHSDQPEEGGDLGFFNRGELVEEFEAVVFSLLEGEISPVFLTQFGYHVAKTIARKPAAPYPLDEVRDAIRQQIKTDARNAAVQKYIQELKAAATIEGEGEDAEEAEAAVETT